MIRVINVIQNNINECAFQLYKVAPKATLQTESSALDDIQPRVPTNLYKQRQRCSRPNVLKSLLPSSPHSRGGQEPSG